MNFHLRGKGCCGGKRPDKESVSMGAKCVCSMSVLVMDDGVVGYGSSIHTAAAPRLR